ncbi:hypothetical protein Slin15195_G063130 [Septoria linicola]|uniref:Uncharacterized protein n=1 Tax=Septoria linicola TaxID=215465 RepID=A0A9Q9EK84_9PEZI|nr:hypothetical protein Slin14017_G113440 [Septoria linicola]USW52994.1 hypothetical protein Slin15195_G063130 [Septoria linicola]
MGRGAIYKFINENHPPASEPDAMTSPSESLLDQPDDEHEQSASVSAAEDASQPTLTPELYALAKSQKDNQPPALTRKNPRHLQPSIPALNARMRPMPGKRVKNMQKKWYAYLLNCILPPLPTKEWEQLRDWAHGKNLPQISIPRRSNVSPHEFRHFGKYSALEAIVIQGRIDKSVYGNREAHAITPRFMQRLWATVFSTCPYMTNDNATNEWNVRWGHQEIAASILDDVKEITEAGDLDKMYYLQKPYERKVE